MSAIFSWECISEEGPYGTLTYLQALDNGWWKSGSIMVTNLLRWELLALCTGWPRSPGIHSAPAHADGCLLTLGPDAKASACRYNVMLMPCGPGGLAGCPQTGITSGRPCVCLPGWWIHPRQTETASFHLLIVIQKLCTFLTAIKDIFVDWCIQEA